MSDVTRQIIGESSFQANEDQLNQVLKSVAAVINRRDVTAGDKLELIHQQTAKAREQLLGIKPK